MHDSRTVEMIPLVDDELETVAAGMFVFEAIVESMHAQQAMMTTLSQTLQGLSEGSRSAVNNL